MGYVERRAEYTEVENYLFIPEQIDQVVSGVTNRTDRMDALLQEADRSTFTCSPLRSRPTMREIFTAFDESNPSIVTSFRHRPRS